jgi:hypothetical protein
MGSSQLYGKSMCIELTDNLLNSGTCLVLHGERELTDADLAQLRDFSEKQRAAITTVVLSNTDITGECFRYLVLLPNLKALYANETRVNDDAPFECLPRSIEVVNLDHTEVGDVCVSKLKMAPNLYSVRLCKTGITNRGANLLATMSSLRDCQVDGITLSEHTRQRLVNAIALHAITFNKAAFFLLYSLQRVASKCMLRVRGARFTC